MPTLAIASAKPDCISFGPSICTRKDRISLYCPGKRRSIQQGLHPHARHPQDLIIIQKGVQPRLTKIAGGMHKAREMMEM
jgi:hypothetical protein